MARPAHVSVINPSSAGIVENIEEPSQPLCVSCHRRGFETCACDWALRPHLKVVEGPGTPEFSLITPLRLVGGGEPTSYNEFANWIVSTRLSHPAMRRQNILFYPRIALADMPEDVFCNIGSTCSPIIGRAFVWARALYNWCHAHGLPLIPCEHAYRRRACGFCPKCALSRGYSDVLKEKTPNMEA